MGLRRKDVYNRSGKIIGRKSVLESSMENLGNFFSVIKKQVVYVAGSFLFSAMLLGMYFIGRQDGIEKGKMLYRPGIAEVGRNRELIIDSKYQLLYNEKLSEESDKVVFTSWDYLLRDPNITEKVKKELSK